MNDWTYSEDGLPSVIGKKVSLGNGEGAWVFVFLDRKAPVVFDFAQDGF
jgi:hypothetical protein